MNKSVVISVIYDDNEICYQFSNHIFDRPNKYFTVWPGLKQIFTSGVKST